MQYAGAPRRLESRIREGLVGHPRRHHPGEPVERSRRCPSGRGFAAAVRLPARDRRKMEFPDPLSNTTRADHLGCYGFEEAVTPNLDRFARESGVLFENAFSPIPLTLPSHHHHDRHLSRLPWHPRQRRFILDEGVTTLAEMLSGADFETGAVVASYPVDSQFSDEGFASYNDDYYRDGPAPRSRRAPRCPSASCSEPPMRSTSPLSAGSRSPDSPSLDALFDPHQSYDPPPPRYDTLLPSRYDGEIGFADVIGRCWTSRRTRNPRSDDHRGRGRSRRIPWRPRRATHASYIYDPTIRIPLIISVPSSEMANCRWAHLPSGSDDRYRTDRPRAARCSR